MHLNHDTNFFVTTLQNTTKEGFVVDVVKFTFQHKQLYTHHHATKVIETRCPNVKVLPKGKGLAKKK